MRENQGKSGQIKDILWLIQGKFWSGFGKYVTDTYTDRQQLRCTCAARVNKQCNTTSAPSPGRLLVKSQIEFSSIINTHAHFYSTKQEVNSKDATR